jgi:competence protein ComEC
MAVLAAVLAGAFLQAQTHTPRRMLRRGPALPSPTATARPPATATPGPTSTPTPTATPTRTATPTPRPTSTPVGVTVYVTPSGTKYHLWGCQYIGQNYTAMTVAQACAAGKTPCSVCRPPSCP